MIGKQTYRFLFLLIMALVVLAVALPGLAQDTTTTFVDYDVLQGDGFISVYGIDADGERHLIATLPIATAATAVEAVEPGDATILGYLIVNTSYLNVRSGDGAGYTVLGIVSGGDTLDVIGRNHDRSWWFVDAGGVEGWVANQHVIVRGDLRDVPVVISDGVLIQPTLYVGFPDNPLWNDLSAAGVILCRLPGRSEFPLVGRSAGGNWYQIVAECDGEVVVGWIRAEQGLVRNPAAIAIPVTYR